MGAIRFRGALPREGRKNFVFPCPAPARGQTPLQRAPARGKKSFCDPASRPCKGPNAPATPSREGEKLLCRVPAREQKGASGSDPDDGRFGRTPTKGLRGNPAILNRFLPVENLFHGLIPPYSMRLGWKKSETRRVFLAFCGKFRWGPTGENPPFFSGFDGVFALISGFFNRVSHISAFWKPLWDKGRRVGLAVFHKC